MSSISRKSTKQTINSYLFHYRSCFHKRSFEIFCWLIRAILCSEEVRSVKFLYDTFISKYSDKVLNSLYYFLSYLQFPIESLLKTTCRIALALIPKENEDTPVLLIIDDTLQPKFGTKFDCYSRLFDHTKRNGSLYLNGHCFVALMLAIPVKHAGKTHYLSIPLAYRLYEKDTSKLQIATDLIDSVMNELKNQKVFLLCDSWYPKGPIIEVVKKHENLEILCGVRHDTAMYDLPVKEKKRGRPAKRGKRMHYQEFQYEKTEKFYIANKQVMTNLFDIPVWVTITTIDIDKFSSVRVFLSTASPDQIPTFSKPKTEADEAIEVQEEITDRILKGYSLRWNIEVLFYQQKSFWSFGKYMVRGKVAIERYVNLLGIAFSLVTLLPFIEKQYETQQFQSPQTTKRIIGAQLTQELILERFVSCLETSDIYSRVKEAAISFLLGNKDAS